MNKERLEKLAEHLDKLPRKSLKMSMWGIGGNGCGCIGHHAEGLFGDAWSMGLTGQQGDSLFFPDGYWHNTFDPTPKQAAKVIRNLIKTGKVEWEKFV